MERNELEIPLFPLNVVLFPTMVLPILVFEERYKTMINRCLETESDFGVALIKSGREVGGPAVPFQVGTMAHITEVERKEDGKMNISVMGTRRFTLLEVTQETPYMAGIVRLLEDDQKEDDSELMAKSSDVVKSCIGELLAINGEWVRHVQLPPSAAELSYLIAVRLPVEQRIKQRFLEADSASDRLRMELPLLELEAQRLRGMLINSMWLRSASLN